MKQRKGIALVVSLMILLIMTLLGVAIMMFSINEEQIVGNQMRHIRSLAYAEAGVSEVVRRLNLEEIGDPMVGGNYAPDWKTYVLLNASPPGPQGNTYFVSSAQMTLPGSLLLEYSTEYLDTLNSLVVHHKVNPAHLSEIFYYNWNTRTEESYNPATYDGEFFPIEVVDATGMLGTARRKIRVEVVRRSGPCNIASAMSCNQNTRISGALKICGHDHLYETPGGDSIPPNGLQPPACFHADLDSSWHVHRSDGNPHANEVDDWKKTIPPDPVCTETGCLPGVSVPENDLDTLGAYYMRGNPDATTDENIAEFYELWQMLGASSYADLLIKYDWQDVGPGVVIGNYVGFFRCDGDIAIKGNWEGVIWVTGHLSVSANTDCRGLFFAQGDLKLNGGAWILGALACGGETTAEISPVSGTATVLYSSDAIQRAIAAGSGYTTISWSEQ